jgi:hypothetical protein
MKILISFISSQTTSSFINLFPVLLIPAAIIGVGCYYRYRASHSLICTFTSTLSILKNRFSRAYSTTAQHRSCHFINQNIWIWSISIFIIIDKFFHTLKKGLELRLFLLLKSASLATDTHKLWIFTPYFRAHSAEKWKNRFLFWFKPTSGRTVNWRKLFSK